MGIPQRLISTSHLTRSMSMAASSVITQARPTMQLQGAARVQPTARSVAVVRASAANKNPAQESTNASRVSSSVASASSFNMEGTQKGGLSPKKKRAIMDKVKK